MPVTVCVCVCERREREMSLGKRGRPPMKRTTSMTEFILDPVNGGAENAYPPLDPHHNPFNGGFSGSAAASPRAHRRNSADFIEAGIHFLRVCSLCKRRLIPGHDIYMYRYVCSSSILVLFIHATCIRW